MTNDTSPTTGDRPHQTEATGGERIDLSNLDAVGLSALMSSRLCHDLVNPVGALSSGLDVLDDPEVDEEMREDALDLIKSSTEKAVALLKYARLAYGQAGGAGAEIPYDEARDVLVGLYASAKASLDWRAPTGQGPKEEVKALLALANAAADCVPRGGVVVVSPDQDGFRIEASGPRLFLNEETLRAVAADPTDLKPKQAPLYLSSLAVRQAGGQLSAEIDGEKAVMLLRFPRTRDALPSPRMTA